MGYLEATQQHLQGNRFFFPSQAMMHSKAREEFLQDHDTKISYQHETRGTNREVIWERFYPSLITNIGIKLLTPWVFTTINNHNIMIAHKLLYFRGLFVPVSFYSIYPNSRDNIDFGNHLSNL